MRIKRMKIAVTVCQAAFVLILFLPVAKDFGSAAALSTVDLARRYAEIGYVAGAAFYLASAVLAPAAAVLFAWLLRAARKGFGMAACLSAYTELVHVCFYSALKTALAGSVRLTGTYLFICLFVLFGMFVCIRAYLLAAAPRHSSRKP